MSGSRLPCRDCGNPQTHAQRRIEVDRMIKAGLSRADAVEAMPLCRRCCVSFLNNRPVNRIVRTERAY